MKIKFSLSVFITLCSFIVIFSQRPDPGAKQNKSILLKGGIAHIGNGTVIENSGIGFQNGKITVVIDYSKPSSNLTDFDTVIDITGKHVYPGLILLNTTLGLREVDAVRATLDYSESGNLTPEVRSVVAFNTDSKIIPTVRRNGILIAQPTPQGGWISGTSGVVHLDGWNWEDAAIRMEDGIHLHWPQLMQKIYSWEKDVDLNKIKEARKNNLNAIKKILEDAKFYSGKEFNIRLKSLLGIFDGTKNLYLHVNAEKDIIESVSYLKTLGVKNIVLVGAEEGVNVLSFIRDHQLPVILHRVHELPLSEDEDIRQPFKLAKKFYDAGILISIDYSGDMEAMGSRNLPFTAGTTVTYGLAKEEAVKLITFNAAKILGIDQNYGSLEIGKSATLFVSTGDALDMITNNVEHAFIDGRKLELNSIQEKLFDTYSEKYGIK